MRDFIHLFGQAIEAAGIAPPADIIPDDRLHRFSTNGKVSDTAGWYVLYGDEVPVGVFGCWRSGFESTWASKADCDFTPAERQLYREQVKSAQRQRDAEMMRSQEMSSAVAAEPLAKSKTVVAPPCLKAKNVDSNGLTAEDDVKQVPIHDNHGKVHSLQTIDPGEKRRLLAGGKIKDEYFAVGVPDMYIIACEKLTAGLTIRLCTGLPIAVAHYVGDLTAVAQALQREYPGVRIIIAAADDWSTPSSPRRTAAIRAALAVGGRVVLPSFPLGRPEVATDFDDLLRMAGCAAVIAAFADVLGG